MTGPRLHPPPPPTTPPPVELGAPLLGRGWTAPPVRSDEIDYVPFEDVDLEGAMAIVGISALGGAGSLVARYLVARLDMELIGAFSSERLFPAGTSHGGVMTSTLQAWRAEVDCGLDGQCRQLLVIQNDLPIDLNVMVPLARSIARWARKKHIPLLVGCESYPIDEGDRRAQVLAAVSLSARDLLDRVDAKPLDDAIVVGFDAALLTSANCEDVRAVVFFGPHEQGSSDSQAAAEALRTARDLLPDIGIEQAALEAELEKLDEIIRRQVRAALSGRRMERGYAGYA